MGPAASLQPLPDGWSEGRDPGSGAVYYYNVATGAASCWQHEGQGLHLSTTC